MKKADLINRIAEEAELSRKQASDAIDAFIANIKDSLRGEKKVAIKGFGTFFTAKRKERKWVNPKTRELHTIKEKKTVKFKPGKKLVDEIN